MITTKQRAKLRGMANNIETILQVGKGGIGETLITQVSDALKAREIIKIKVLETSPVTARESAQQLSEAVEADIVQVIGSKFVLFKKNPKDSKINID